MTGGSSFAIVIDMSESRMAFGVVLMAVVAVVAMVTMAFVPVAIDLVKAFA